MNFIEAVKAMKRGGKVKLPQMAEGVYLYDYGNFILDQDGKSAYASFATSFLSEEWYIYEEKPTAVVDNTKRVVRFNQSKCEEKCDNYVSGAGTCGRGVCALNPGNHEVICHENRTTYCIEKFGTGEENDQVRS